jgi:mono/diheme cytochrome c family protein
MSRGSRCHPEQSTRLSMTLLCIVMLLVLGGCRQKMANQPRYDPLEGSDFFADGMASRPRLAGTVARGELGGDPYFESGLVNGQPGDGFPFAVTEAVMNRGHERFDIYCSQCHGRLGDGNGMIPSRGFRRPPSFHTLTLRNAKAGHFFDVMTNGFGSMPPYKTMISAEDRWAIAAYIRALQASQNATMNDVPLSDRAKVDGGAPGVSPGESTRDTRVAPQGGGH